MDFLPIIVLIVFVLLGGIIAVIADELGRRIGKRRLTLHRRIRPKYSARILTFLSGMLITMFTMFLIGVSSSDMRDLLLRGRTLIAEGQKKIEDQKTKLEQLTAQQQKLQTQNKDLTSQRDTLQTQLQNAGVRLKGADDKLKTYEARLVDAKTKSEIAASRATELNRRMAGLTRLSISVNQELVAKKADLATKKKDLASLQTQYLYISNEYRSTSTQNLKLEQQKEGLEKQVNAKAKEVQDANKSVDDLNSQKSALQQEISADQMNLDQLRTEVADASRQLDTMKDVVESATVHARFDGILFSQGEELARVEVPAGTSKDGAFARIETALLLAKDTAKSRGAKPWSHLDYAGMKPMRDRQDQEISVDAQKDLLASDLAGRPDDQILIARVYMNAFSNESVVVTFGYQPNPIVYQPDQAIAEVRVNGRQDFNQILASLDGLGALIRKQALKNRMIPVQRPDMSLGSVSSAEILSLVGEIQKAGGSVRVRAKARRLTRAADPLLLDFEVR